MKDRKEGVVRNEVEVKKTEGSSVERWNMCLVANISFWTMGYMYSA